MAESYRRVAFLPVVAGAGPQDDRGMYAPHCPRHGTRVLLPLDAIEVTNTAAGIEVRWRCSCGHVGRHLTGAPTAASIPTPASITATAPVAPAWRECA
jgi:hypothetical protein